MRTPRKASPANKEPSLKEKLSASFLAAFESDFKTHGISVIEKLRVDDPAKYVEVGAKLIAAVEQSPAPDGYATCRSQQDIARKILHDVGAVDEGITTDMIDKVVELQLEFTSQIERIAGGH
jgi:hypothetical protein